MPSFLKQALVGCPINPHSWQNSGNRSYFINSSPNSGKSITVRLKSSIERSSLTLTNLAPHSNIHEGIGDGLLCGFVCRTTHVTLETLSLNSRSIPSPPTCKTTQVVFPLINEFSEWNNSFHPGVNRPRSISRCFPCKGGRNFPIPKTLYRQKRGLLTFTCRWRRIFFKKVRWYVISER